MSDVIYLEAEYIKNKVDSSLMQIRKFYERKIDIIYFNLLYILNCVLGAQRTFSLRRFFWVPTTYVLDDK